MGYQVAVIGHMDVTPPLNDAEYAYLSAFAESRRWDRPQGPFHVPWTPPSIEEQTRCAIERRNRRAKGQPGLWCAWYPSCRGRCLAVMDPERNDGKAYGVTPWLRYLIDAFLRPGALASRDSTVPDFERFTFDHVVSGAVAAHRTDTGELWLVRAADNEVTHETIREPDQQTWEEITGWPA